MRRELQIARFWLNSCRVSQSFGSCAAIRSETLVTGSMWSTRHERMREILLGAKVLPCFIVATLYIAFARQSQRMRRILNHNSRLSFALWKTNRKHKWRRRSRLQTEAFVRMAPFSVMSVWREAKRREICKSSLAQRIHVLVLESAAKVHGVKFRGC